MKKLISTILTLALIFAVNTTAFASEANKALPAAESVETTEVFFGNTDAVRIGSSEETRPPLVFTPCIYPLIVYNISVKTTLDETNNREWKYD